jgi:hypothetical protein
MIAVESLVKDNLLAKRMMKILLFSCQRHEGFGLAART